MSTADTETETPTSPRPSPSPDGRSLGDMTSSGRRLGDSVFSYLSVGSGLLIFLTLAAVAVFLTTESLPAVIASQEFSGTEDFSLVGYALPLVYGTVLASAIALLIAIPISIGIALFISHYAPRRLAATLGYMIDLLAAVPSVVYGLWGGIWLVPELEPLYGVLHTYLGWSPLFAGEPTAPMRHLASASAAPAVRVLTVIAAATPEASRQPPRLPAERALALGATRGEPVRPVVLPFGRGGIVAASMLGLGRALGQTMAVLMILAPGATFSLHILEVGRHNSIAANIASKSAEASGVDMSLLVFTGLVLFVLTFVINAVARWIVARSGPKS